jgi:hypothetical protein
VQAEVTSDSQYHMLPLFISYVHSRVQGKLSVPFAICATVCLHSWRERSDIARESDGKPPHLVRIPVSQPNVPTQCIWFVSQSRSRMFQPSASALFSMAIPDEKSVSVIGRVGFPYHSKRGTRMLCLGGWGLPRQFSRQVVVSIRLIRLYSIC